MVNTWLPSENEKERTTGLTVERSMLEFSSWEDWIFKITYLYYNGKKGKCQDD